MDANINPEAIKNEANENLETSAPAYEPSPEPEPSYVRIPHTPANPANVDFAPTNRPNVNPQRPGRIRGGLLGLMLSGMLMLGMLLGGAGAGAVMLFTGNTAAMTTAMPTTASTTGTTSTAPELVAQANQSTINSIYQKISPSVVMITSVVQSNNGRFSTTGEATGTGIVLDKQGNILTNYHVIDGASSIKVQFSDGTEYTATVAGTAQQDDLAVIKVSVPSDKLTPAALGDSSTVKVGDEVIAIGYPYGLDQSVTSGIVSGLNRDGSGSSNGRTLTGLIQVDAAINPGNSGGPLLNAQGEVIGLDTMIESPVDGFTGVGLAIPINHVKDLLSQLEQGGQVQRPWIGISGTEITSGLQQQYNLPVSQGILVIDVTAGGPAQAAGLQGSTIAGSQGFGSGNQGSQTGQIGDIITAIDGHALGTVADLTSYLNSKQPGDQVTLSIIRNGQQQSVKVTLAAWSASTSTGSTGTAGTSS